MGKSKALVEAEARLAELRGIEDAWEAHKAERDAAMEPNRARKHALERRHERVLIITSAGGRPNSEGGGISLTSLRGITPAYGWLGYGEDRQLPKAGDLAKRMLSGDQRVNGHGGTAYTLRGLLQRSKAIDKPRLAQVNRAIKARERAQRNLHSAWRAEREAYAAAYESGDKLDLEATAKAIAQRAVIPTEPVYDRELAPAHGLQWEITEAERHLAWVKAKNPDTDVCPCGGCQRERRERADADKEEQRIAGLPTVMFTCPDDQKRHRGSVDLTAMGDYQINDKLAELLDEKAPGWRALSERGDYGRVTYSLERLWCPVHRHWLIFTTAIAKRAAAAAKAAAKRDRGAKVEWTCPVPECAEPVITLKPAPDAEFIECPVCGTETVIASIAMRRYVGTKAPTTEAADEEVAA